jgi:hypothetical protein
MSTPSKVLLVVIAPVIAPPALGKAAASVTPVIPEPPPSNEPNEAVEVAEPLRFPTNDPVICGMCIFISIFQFK